MIKIEGIITDLGCQACVNKITKALEEKKGIVSIKIEQPTKKCNIEFHEGEITADEIVAVVKAAGYTLALS